MTSGFARSMVLAPGGRSTQRELLYNRLKGRFAAYDERLLSRRELQGLIDDPRRKEAAKRARKNGLPSASLPAPQRPPQ